AAQRRPDVVTYSSVVAACNRAARWEMALLAVTKMRRASVLPNLVSVCAAMGACLKGRQWKETLQLFSGLRDVLPKTAAPNAVAYTCAFQAIEAAGPQQQKKAMEVWFDMTARAVRPDVVSHSAAMQASGGHVNAAGERFFRRAAYTPIVRKLALSHSRAAATNFVTPNNNNIKNKSLDSNYLAVDTSPATPSSSNQVMDSPWATGSAPDLGAFTRETAEDFGLAIKGARTAFSKSWLG
ncbi:unnamed protein product, partial [Polarella glacialis]